MPPGSGDELDSWKEIAVHMNRSVRTVRRWEKEEALPVHRHVHRALSSVFALRSELDAWRKARSLIPAWPGRSAASTGLERQKSIAILTFENLSIESENEYFADGLTDEVRVVLSRVRALRVISRTSSRAFRGTKKDVKTIAGELGVRYLLEGSVRREGLRLRITAQLIDATRDEHLWADTYDGTVEDVFAIQDRLARVIVDALKLRLTPDEEQRLAERSIDSLPAYECYLRARQEGWRWQKDAIDHAVHLLRTGLTIIGDNVRLYAALGLVHLQYREAGIDFGERPLQEAEACAAKVFALDPASEYGRQLRGWIHYSRGRIQEAVQDLKAALDVDVNNADTLLLLSNCYLISGRVSVARPLIARLLQVDPLTPLTRCMPAWADILDGKPVNAVDAYRQMLEMDPRNPMARLFYVWVLILNGRAEDEVQSVLEEFKAEVRDSVPARMAFFLAHARNGNLAGMEAVMPPALQAVTAATDVFPRFLAQGFAMAGLAQPAVRCLQIAIERGFINHPYLADHDPSFSSLRDDPRFKELLDIVHDRWERFES